MIFGTSTAKEESDRKQLKGFMKILIRDANQSRYLDIRDKWVADMDKARDFGRGKEAISHAKNLGLNGIDLFYVFPNPMYNFGTPLDAYEVPDPDAPNGTARPQTD